MGEPEQLIDNLLVLRDSVTQLPAGTSTTCLWQNPSLLEAPHRLQPPGGTTTICLGTDDSQVLVDVGPSGRKPPGGDTTICLGSDEELLDSAVHSASKSRSDVNVRTA